MKKITLLLNLIIISISLFAQLNKAQVSILLKQKGVAHSDFIITSQYTDKQTEITHIYMRQIVNGIEIFNVNPSLHVNKSNEIVTFNNDFIAQPEVLVNTTTAKLDYLTAIQHAASHVGVNVLQAMSKQFEKAKDGQITFNSEHPLSVKKYYFLTEDNNLKLTWNVEVFNPETNDWWNVRVDATDGSVLDKNNWTTHCNQHETCNRLMTNKTASVSLLNQASTQQKNKKTTDGTYHVLPYYFESPNHGDRELLSSPATTNASPFGWHDTDGVAGADFTITRGNNVYAKEDTLARNGFGYSPNGGTNLEFNYPYSRFKPARASLDAAITNLFYMNNIMHDVFYNYGFDEASGNFQANNYGKGGAERDGVHADAQDGSGTNNANFSTPADGTRGRMQMYIWNPSGTQQNVMIKSSSLAGLSYPSQYAAFGPKPFDTLTAELILVNDSTSNPTFACSSVKNDLTGKIALVFRGGTCNYVTRVLNAQNAGAIGVIVVNNTTSTTTMTGTSSLITIPSLMVNSTNGVALRSRLDSNISLSVSMIPPVQFDSDMDNVVIAHEYGHGISNRLSGGPLNSSCLSGQEQAGEGWSDFFGLALTAKASDSSSAKGIGTWLSNQPTSGLGIRTYRYSRNLTTNPVTYNSIKTLSVPHGVGTVWCSMLYDIMWDMSDKYGFNDNIYDPTTGGNNMTLQLVIDALKLQPCNPGFVNLRNSIIAADSIRYGGANKELLWRAFARRGLGLSANQGAVTSRTDGEEAFDLPEFTPINTGLYSENAWKTVTMIPNPANDYVSLALPDGTSFVKVTLYDLAGKQIAQMETSQFANGVARFDINSIENGLYLLKATDGVHVYQTKLLKQSK